MPVQVIVFGGTREGREIARMLADAKVPTMLCVAASFGEEPLEPREFLSVTEKRLDAGAMAVMLAGNGCALAVDATHPYAFEASASIREACSRANVELVRLVRDASDVPYVTVVESAQQAADLLNQSDERVLLTLGSKELQVFTGVRGYRERLFVRVLPSVDVLQKCIALGFSANRVICMHGPFTRDMNAATIRMLGVSCVVTKDSGRAGGLLEKIAAAQTANCRLILIRRTTEPEQGLGYDAVCALLAGRFGFTVPQEAPPQPPVRLTPRFPLFVDIAGRRAVVVGGGKIAYRCVEMLLEFGADIRVIAPELSKELAKLVREDRVTWLKSAFEPNLAGIADLLVAAADECEVNRSVVAYAKEMRILVSVPDNPDAGSFVFPAIVRSEKFIAGIVSSTGDNTAAKKLERIMRKNMDEPS